VYYFCHSVRGLLTSTILTECINDMLVSIVGVLGQIRNITIGKSALQHLSRSNEMTHTVFLRGAFIYSNADYIC
jgi:hypothetical protein